MSWKVRFQHIWRSDLNKRLIGHSSWILIGNLISKSILLIATILLTRYMGKEEYGQFGIIKSTIVTFSVFAGLELGLTATKYISQYRKVDPSKVERIVGLSNLFAVVISLIVCGIMFFFARKIADSVNAPSLYREIQVSSFILFFSALNGVQNGVLSGVESFKKLSINNAIAGIASSVLMVIVAAYAGLYAVVIAFGMNFVLLFFLNFLTLKKVFYSTFRVNMLSRQNFSEIGVLWQFTLPAILAGLMVGPVVWLCNYLLVNQPNGYQNMAVFDIANQWRNTILFIPAALAQIALPMLSSSVANQEEYKLVLKRNIQLNLVIAGTLVLVLLAASPLIVNFYGSEYHDLQIPLSLMFITTGFVAVNNVIGNAIASKNRMWAGFFINLLWALILVGATYIFVVHYHYGVTGITLAYLISYSSHTLIQFLYLKKLLV